MMPQYPFHLTVEERNSPLWRKLMARWEEQLEALRLQNDAHKGETDTAFLRGRIFELKACLNFNKDMPTMD